jgi:hypothetical protein
MFTRDSQWQRCTAIQTVADLLPRPVLTLLSFKFGKVAIEAEPSVRFR